MENELVSNTRKASNKKKESFNNALSKMNTKRKERDSLFKAGDTPNSSWSQALLVLCQAEAYSHIYVLSCINQAFGCDTKLKPNINALGQKRAAKKLIDDAVFAVINERRYFGEAFDVAKSFCTHLGINNRSNAIDIEDVNEEVLKLTIDYVLERAEQETELRILLGGEA